MDNCLKTGYELLIPGQHEKYTIIDVVGRGSSVIAYLAQNELGDICILKEYCPQNIFTRRSDKGSLLCKESNLDKFEQGKLNFRLACEKQHKIRNIIQLRNVTPPSRKILEANNTLYLEVTSFSGKTLDCIQAEALLVKIKVCLALAELVLQYHKNDLLCLDIKPNNVFVLIKPSGEIVTDIVEYIDFDSIQSKQDLSFGNSMSYTEAWSAPEQQNPYAYNKIGNATDIYAIGELVFWFVFGRHSTDNEHRDYSVYPFDEISDSQTQKLVSRPVVQSILAELFHSTLRSSPANRFQSIDAILPLLKNLVKELSKEEWIFKSKLNKKSFFIGRQKELEDIKQALQTDDIVFVSGVAGIGKSEIVKRYVALHKAEYDNILYWTYEGNLDNMVTRDASVGINNFTRLDEETDSQYARRKLEKLRELLDGQNNLIVIDNMDRSIDELTQQETWEFLNNLPGKLLISTRVKESLHKTIEILPLSDIGESLCLFREYCAFDDENSDDVIQIIESVNRNTSLIELLAHYTKATHSTPKQTLEKLQRHGICGLSTETVRLLKDGKEENHSVFSHVEKIFSMEAMSEEQILVLSMCALMPVDGVQTTKFASFCSLDNYNDLNWLSSHGWIYVGFDESELIAVHPTIASVVIEHLKANEHLLKHLYSKCYDAIRYWDSKELKDSERVLYADALALSTTDRFSIKSRCAAVFIEQYVDMYSKYGNAEQKMRQIDFAIEVLRQYTSENKYSAILEQCHYQKAYKLYALCQYEHAISLCKEHLEKAMAAKDPYFAAKWCILLAGIYNSYDHQSNGFVNQLNYYFRGIHYAYKIERDVSRKKPHFLESGHLINDLDYDYMESAKNRYHANLMLDFANWMENQSAMVLYCSKGSRIEISNLTRATSMRERITKDTKLRYTNNSFEIFIDKARIAFLSGKYQEADSLLRELVDYCTKRNLVDTSTMYRVHQFLAHIALRQRPIDYAHAIEEFENCLEISENLSSHNTYMVRLELGYIYVVCGELEKAEKLNTELWRESRSLAPEIRKTYYADALRNVGYLHYRQGDHYVARNMLRRALEEYDKANAPIDMVWFGKARTYRLLAEWCYSNNCDPSEVNIKTAIERLSTAVDMYKSSVGLEHPEAEAARNRLTEITKQL